MEIIKVVIIGIAVVLLAIEIKAHKPVLGIVLGMAGALLITTISLDKVLGVLSGIKEVIAYLGNGAEYFLILLKVLGVTYLCQFSSGICRDAGFSNISDQIHIFGKLYIMLSGLPILLAFIETIQQL